MTRRSWIQFFALSALWGASYLFIKVALEDVSPAVVVFARTALASLVLLPFAIHTGALAGLRDRKGVVALLAVLQIVAPFLLISVGQREISSSLAGILVATAPIFTFLLGIRLERDRNASGVGVVGVVMGIAGVALLLGVDTGGEGAALLGGLLVVLASLGYALGAFYFRRNMVGVKPIGAVTVSMGVSAVMVLPLALATLPADLPGAKAVGALTALGVLGTGVSFVLFYTLIAEVGPTKSSLVAYVAPGFSVLYGVTLLGEPFGVATLAGLIMIVGGSWLTAEGRLPWRPRAVTVNTHPTNSPPAGGAQPDRRSSEHRTRFSVCTMTTDLTIRLSTESDSVALGRLAQLDSTLYDGSQVLVAVAGGRIQAAIALDGRTHFADPFERTAEAVALLELRVGQVSQVLSGSPPAGRRRRGYRAPASA